MDRDKRRTLIIVITLGVVVIGPLSVLSPWGMDELEATAQRNNPKPWAGTLQLWCADAYGWTLRREQERAAYETFYREFTTDPRRGYAKFMVAVCLDRGHQESKRAAVEAYEDFLEEFEADELFHTLPEWQEYVGDAKRAIERLKSIA